METWKILMMGTSIVLAVLIIGINAYSEGVK